MERNISFIHEGNQYLSFIGSDYITKSFGSNAATFKDLMTKVSYQQEMRKLNNGSPRFGMEFPKVDDAVVEVVDGYYLVTGTTEIDGVKYPVKLTKDSVTIGSDEPMGETAIAETPVSIEETAVKSDALEAEVAGGPVDAESTSEPGGSVDPVEDSEVEKSSETEVAVEERAEETELTDAGAEEALAAIVVNADSGVPVVGEAEIESITPVIGEPNPGELTKTGMGAMSVDAAKSTLMQASMDSISAQDPGSGLELHKGDVFHLQPQAMPETKVRVGIKVGCEFGQRVAEPLGITIGESEVTCGCEFGVQQSKSSRYSRSHKAGRGERNRTYIPQSGVQVVVAPKLEPNATTVPFSESAPANSVQVEPAPSVTMEQRQQLQQAWQSVPPIGERTMVQQPDKSVEEVAAAYREKHGVVLEKKPEAPQPLVPPEAEPESEAVVKRDELEVQVRQTLSKEVNDVIGSIPLDLLDKIEEFTLMPVDVDAVRKGGTLYCIDHRWHKSGNWYCLDVVPNTSRFFYNSNQNIAIEISLKDLKEWSKIFK